MPGIINPLDPIGSQVEQMAIDRQRMLAAALQQQSMTPAEGQMISGHYVAPSWTQFAAKLAQGLSGKSMNEDLDRKTVDYQRKAMQQMVGALGGAGGQNVAGALAQGAASGSVGPTTANAARLDASPVAGGTTASPLNPAGMDPRLAAYMLMSKPEEYWKAQTAALAPTEATRMATQGGVDPRAANVAALGKANFIPPMDVKPGGTLVNAQDGRPLFVAPEANGNRFTYDALGNPTMSRTPGADATVSAAAAAELAGKNRETPAPKDMLPTLPDGTVIPRTVAQTIGQGNFPRAEPQVGNIQPGKSDQLSILQQERAKATKPEDIAALDREIARAGGAPSAVGAKYGQKESIEGQQEGLKKRWGELQAQNATAETNNSYLQSIKGLADKAIVGAQADKLALANGLLAMVGNEKATDAKTANDLLSKYSSQIAVRLGQGTLGTDSARTLIEAANPNSKMEKGAIKEAVDNIVGSNRMTQAKTQLLQKHALALDPVEYTKAETAFDQSADPRIWQYASMQPAERAAFKAKLSQQGIAGEFGNKIRTLESLGVKF